MRLEDVKVPACLPDNETVRKDLCDYYLRSAAIRSRGRRDLLERARSEGRVGEHAGRDDRRQRPALPALQEQPL